MRPMATLLFAALALRAQQPATADLLRRTDGLEAAIQVGDWTRAAQLSRDLKAAVQDARNHAMAAAATELRDSILAWLPADTETLIVAQQPFTIVAQDGTKVPSALESARGYVLFLLGAPEQQMAYKALTGRTVRLAALAARRFGEDPSGDREPLPR